MRIFIPFAGQGHVRWSSLLREMMAKSISTTYQYDDLLDSLPLSNLLQESTTSPASVLQTDDGAKTSQYCIDFNPRQRNFLAVAEGNGFARIWKLRWKLSNMYPSELSDISSLADQAQQDDESK